MGKRLCYSITVVGNNGCRCWYDNHWFDDRQSAERYAEGISFGLWLNDKKWGVVMLLNGKYDSETTIVKNLTSKQSEQLFKVLSRM